MSVSGSISVAAQPSDSELQDPAGDGVVSGTEQFRMRPEARPYPDASMFE